MDCFIYSSQILKNNLQLLEKKYNKINISPNTITTESCIISLPSYINTEMLISIKELYELIQSGKFVKNGQKVSYSLLIANDVKIYKTITVADCNKIEFKIGNYVKIEIDPFVAHFLGQLKKAEFVDFAVIDNKVNILAFSSQFKVDITFMQPKQFKCFTVRYKELWFLNYQYEKVILCVDEVVAFFYCYEGASIGIHKVNFVTP